MSVKRQAKARLINNTGRDIVVASIVHKYSNQYRNQKTFSSIRQGNSTEEHLLAEYNTGAFATGRDWWLIAWQYDSNALFYTSANTLGDILDFVAPEIKSNELVNASRQPLAYQPLSCTLPSLLAKSLLKSNQTPGFKPHSLKAEDHNQFIDIVLDEAGQACIRSVSATSEIKYTSKKAPMLVETCGRLSLA